ncbi:MAG: hypothetical protein JSW05_12200 [Candidatus Thorarchaeota archaeon]|nr:MAG: hypothetical protein JSW05_12200 [Candidatus Thorarchaeota archaeon]
MYNQMSGMHGLSSKALEDLIRATLGQEQLTSSVASDSVQATKVVGSLLHGVSSSESRVLRLASARLGYQHVALGWDDLKAKSNEALTSDLTMFSQAVDILATVFAYCETFGAGRAITEEFARISEIPMISLADEVFAPQPALCAAASFWEHLGGLKGKKIAICWGFGSNFVLPNTAQSLLLICTSLGADVVLATPPDFSLLRRVIRDSRKRATASGAHFEESMDLEGVVRAADAVFAANWCRLDDFNHPERSTDHASRFRNWYFRDELLPHNCAFLTEPPVQSDLLLDTRLRESDRNLTKGWILKRVQGLIASIRHVEERSTSEKPSTLV